MSAAAPRSPAAGARNAAIPSERLHVGMKLAALYWFYKDFDRCEERLRIMRRFDPQSAIYGLYGGPLRNADEAERRLAPLLDDFWAFPEERDAKWKWANGDLMIARWFSDRGHELDWDTVFVMQWDMLVGAPLPTLFDMLRPGQILLSGFRPIDEVSMLWWWAKDIDAATSRDRRQFQALVATTYGYHDPLFACLFVVACLPRTFLDRYAESGPPTIGFLEYKIPTLARIFGIPVCDSHPFQAGGWNPKAPIDCVDGSGAFLNAIGLEPPRSSILRELGRADGQRLFHPVRKSIKPWLVAPMHARWSWRYFLVLETLQGFKSRLGGAARRWAGSRAVPKRN